MCATSKHLHGLQKETNSLSWMCEIGGVGNYGGWEMKPFTFTFLKTVKDWGA